MQLSTPKGLRLHIAILGRTNVGKSSILNCITQQDVAIVSPHPGTTTDPVEKPMELLPIGPVLFIDTAGLDDFTNLGNLRKNKTIKVLDRTDIILLVTEGDNWTDYEQLILNEAKKRKIPVIVIFNKIDLLKPSQKIKEKLNNLNIPYVETSAIKKDWNTTNIIKQKILESLPAEFIQPKPIIADFIKKNDFIILVIPLDKEAPKGRLILPQQIILREILDKNANAIVTNEKNLLYVLSSIKIKPNLVITDSQVFEEVLKITPDEIPLTSFSILLANNKGDLQEFINGIKSIEKLQNGDKILIAESCTHHPIGDDIGRCKIPKWLKEKTKKEILFDVYSGKDFPQNLSQYKLIVHCGACMLNRKEMLSRIYQAKSQNIPITNYGVLISFLKNGFERALKIFKK